MTSEETILAFRSG